MVSTTFWIPRSGVPDQVRYDELKLVGQQRAWIVPVCLDSFKETVANKKITTSKQPLFPGSRQFVPGYGLRYQHVGRKLLRAAGTIGVLMGVVFPLSDHPNEDQSSEY